MKTCAVLTPRLEQSLDQVTARVQEPEIRTLGIAPKAFFLPALGTINPAIQKQSGFSSMRELLKSEKSAWRVRSRVLLLCKQGQCH